MNQPGNQEPSGLYTSVSTLGKVIGVAAVILGTPMVYGMTKAPLFSYLSAAWGRDIAGPLAWVMGAIEAYLLYESVSFLFTAGVIWAVTRLAMRRFED